jgi:Coenzyme PQQ synthesis protein D (PqqD)
VIPARRTFNYTASRAEADPTDLMVEAVSHKGLFRPEKRLLPISDHSPLKANKEAFQMSDISCNSVVTATKDQVSCDLTGEAAILNLNDGMYYGLNEVGARIWSLLSEPITVSHIRDQLEREYDVDRRRCEKDLVELLGKLEEAGLVEVRNEGAA